MLRSENGRFYKNPNRIELFWSRVLKTETCWIFKGNKDKDGYGVFWFENKAMRAHRFAYLISKGDPGKKLVCHSCDRPECVNPDHLWCGTAKDNFYDCISKGRAPKTRSRGPHLRLTSEQVIKIMSMPENVADISRQLKIPYGTVYDVVNGISWKYITSNLRNQDSPASDCCSPDKVAIKWHMSARELSIENPYPT